LANNQFSSGIHSKETGLSLDDDALFRKAAHIYFCGVLVG
jgi:hypothetical protein